MSDVIWAVEWANDDGAWNFHHAVTSEDGAKLGIQRLRHKSHKEIQFRHVEYIPASSLTAALDEVERLRDVLQQIRCDNNGTAIDLRIIARTALEAK